MNAPMMYSPKDYLLGKCPVPPDVAQLPQKTYVYGGDISINNGSSARLDIALDADSDFLVEGVEMLSSLQTTSQDTFTVQVSDTTYSQPWSNVSVPLRDLAGLGAITHELRYPNMMAPTGTISLSITNNSGSNAQVYTAFHGRKFYNLTDAQRAFLKRRMWYQYVMQVPSIGSGVQGTNVNMQLFNESDFILYDMLSWQAWQYIIGATAGAVSSEITCNFRDTSSDRNFYNQALALRNVIGSYFALNVASGVYVPYTATSGGQFRFRRPMFIRRNGQIQGTFNNLSAGATGAFAVIFEGCRVFDASQ